VPRDYRKLKVFHIVDDLVLAVYETTKTFPNEERFGLTAQMRRAAVSVPANIVEGAARQGEREFLQFLNQAYGSLAELGYFFDLSMRLGYLPTETHAELKPRYEEASRMLNGLMRSIRG
jgi:four helix bundle protein